MSKLAFKSTADSLLLIFLSGPKVKGVDLSIYALTGKAKASMQHADAIERLHPGKRMQKHRHTISYYLFYLLFSEDTWRIAAGLVLAVLLGPPVTRGRNLGQAGEVMVWLMILAIGWSVTAWPAKKITTALKRALQQIAK
jgi:hypothetical protein